MYKVGKIETKQHHSNRLLTQVYSGSQRVRHKNCTSHILAVPYQFMWLIVKSCLQFDCLFLCRLTPDFIAERLGHSNFSELRELDLPHSSLRTVDLGTRDAFYNLRRLVLVHLGSAIIPGQMIDMIKLLRESPQTILILVSF